MSGLVSSTRCSATSVVGGATVQCAFGTALRHTEHCEYEGHAAHWWTTASAERPPSAYGTAQLPDGTYVAIIVPHAQFDDLTSLPVSKDGLVAGTVTVLKSRLVAVRWFANIRCYQCNHATGTSHSGACPEIGPPELRRVRRGVAALGYNYGRFSERYGTEFKPTFNHYATWSLGASSGTCAREEAENADPPDYE